MSGPAPTFDDYRHRYQNIALSRDEDGVLLMTSHTAGGPFISSALSHDELGLLLHRCGCRPGEQVRRHDRHRRQLVRKHRRTLLTID